MVQMIAGFSSQPLKKSLCEHSCKAVNRYLLLIREELKQPKQTNAQKEITRQTDKYLLML